MILLQTVPYLRRSQKFTTADSFGYWVAHQDLVRAALSHTNISGVHFYLPFSREHSREEVAPGLADLQSCFPDRVVELHRIRELPDLAKREPYVLADDLDAFSHLALARHTNGESLFPVTSIVHTIPRAAAMMSYSHLIMLGERFDRIVTTSAAGRCTIDRILNDMESFMSVRLGASVNRRFEMVQIPLAVDDAFLAPGDQEQARVRMALPKDAAIVLYVGRLSETFKADLEPLLTAFRRLSQGMSNLHLVIAGMDGREHYSSRIRALATEKGVDGRVTILSNFPYSQKPDLYRSADVFVSPVDNVQETFGLSILEAMACGLPVVASDWSGYRDLVSHGHTGFLVPTVWNEEAGRMADIVSPFPVQTHHFVAQQTVVDSHKLYFYLKQLLENRELRREYGTAARKKVLSGFTWKASIKQYEGMWMEQLSELKQSPCEWRSPHDLNHQFGHFATSYMDEAALFAPGTLPWPPVQGKQMDVSRIPYPLEFGEMERIMSCCQTRPHSLRELRRDGELTSGAAAWLWKKGYLEVA